MKIAISSQGPNLDSNIDQRLGRAKFFIVYDTQDGTFESINNQKSFESSQGAGIKSADKVVQTRSKALITGQCGPKAKQVLVEEEILIYSCQEVSIRKAIDLFSSNELKQI